MHKLCKMNTIAIHVTLLVLLVIGCLDGAVDVGWPLFDHLLNHYYRLLSSPTITVRCFFYIPLVHAYVYFGTLIHLRT